MDKKTKEQLVLAILGVLLVGVIFWQLLPILSPSVSIPLLPQPQMVPSPQPQTVSSPPQPSPAPQQAKTGQEKKLPPMAEEAVSKAELNFAQLEDPMKPLIEPKDTVVTPEGAVTEELGELTEEKIISLYLVEGIIWDPSKPLALINGKVVGEGEELESLARVKKIYPEKVIITREGRDYTISFQKEE